MNVTEISEPNAFVLVLNGRLDSASSPGFDPKLAQAVAAHPCVVVDLAQLDYISSAGLRVLLKAAKQAKATEKRLFLAALRPAVREIFEISGFTALFAIAPNRTEALAQVK